MDVDERRNFARFQRKDVRVTLLDPMDQVMDDKTVLADISMGGAGLTTRARVLPGEGIKFHVHLPGGALATGIGKVRWVRENGPSFARDCGIEFLDFGWGGYGKVQAEFGGEPGAKSLPRTGVFDALLMAACAIVGLLVFKSLIVSPAMAESATPLIVIGGAALGLILCCKR